jgi:glycosyltransferase involved in cell wall biosynthesis
MISIITINRNNAAGLEKTMRSVASQTSKAFEYIVIDGASTDGSVEVIKKLEAEFPHLKWVSEPDAGIYNAMNKGIRMATGDYCQFLNSGDFLAADDVVEKMTASLKEKDYPDVLYGNMQKVMPDGTSFIDRCGATDDVTLNRFYKGCLNHGPAYIRRALFDEYGFYDETLKICSDWKFYMQSVVLGKATVRYVDMPVTVYDMNGISETRKDILEEERSQLLWEMIPQGILKDYEKYHTPMSQYDRLKKHHLWGVVSFFERVLFKLEKWKIIRK